MQQHNPEKSTISTTTLPTTRLIYNFYNNLIQSYPQYVQQNNQIYPRYLQQHYPQLSTITTATLYGLIYDISNNIIKTKTYTQNNRAAYTNLNTEYKSGVTQKCEVF